MNDGPLRPRVSLTTRGALEGFVPDVPRTILKHRAVRGSEAERLLAAAWRREVDRFMGRPSHPDSPRLARRGSSSGYSKSVSFERDHLTRTAYAAAGYLGPEPDMRDRVARLAPHVAAHFVPGGSAAAALAAHGVPDPFGALGRVFDVTKDPCPSARLTALEIIEFGVDGAMLRASET